MISALGSHRFNPVTGLWEFVSLENVAGVEMSLPATAEAAVAPGLDVADPGLVSAANATWVELSLPAVSGVGAAEGIPSVGTGGPVIALPDPVTHSPSDDLMTVLPVEPELPVIVTPVGPPSRPRVVDGPEGLIVIGGVGPNLLEGGDGNDLVIAGPPPLWVVGLIITSGGVVVYSPRDTLIGGLGQDTLIGSEIGSYMDGGVGADVMIGRGGEDFYVVDDAGDMVIEHPHGGLDVVRSSINYVLPSFIEELQLANGAGDINGTGNEGSNRLSGNEGRNVLAGGAGADLLEGNNGDTLIGGEGQDIFYEAYGLVTGSVVIADFQVGVDVLLGFRFNHWVYQNEGQRWESTFVTPTIRQDEADTIIEWGPGDIRLIGVDMHLLSQRDFGVGW
jgi:hypothetical protein